MAGATGTFVLALRRELQGEAPADWQRRVRELPGVFAAPAVFSHRIQIQADTEALARIRAEFGDYLHIEPLALRKPSD